MIDPTLTCPHCQTPIKLTESLAAPLLEKTQKNHQLQLANQERIFQENLKQERALIVAQERHHARQSVGSY